MGGLKDTHVITLVADSTVPNDACQSTHNGNSVQFCFSLPGDHKNVSELIFDNIFFSEPVPPTAWHPLMTPGLNYLPMCLEMNLNGQEFLINDETHNDFDGNNKFCILIERNTLSPGRHIQLQQKISTTAGTFNVLIKSPREISTDYSFGMQLHIITERQQ